MAKVRMRFVGAGRWDGDEFPFPVPIPRVPSIGEWLMMPDTREAWRITDVTYDYENGLNYDPTVWVTFVPA